MDRLKRTVAPISAKVWDEMEEEAITVLKNNLSARKFTDVCGPLGWDKSSIGEGGCVWKNAQKVQYGVRKVRPLIEVKVPFSVSQEVFEDIDRGKLNPEWGSLDEACETMAQFEDHLIYNGLKDESIDGVLENGYVLKNEEKEFDYLSMTIKAIDIIQKENIGGPYNMIIPNKHWEKMLHGQGYPVEKRIKQHLGGKIIVTDHIDKIIVLSARGGDFEMILGEDLAIGYEGFDSKNGMVNFYINELISFRILGPNAAVIFG